MYSAGRRIPVPTSAFPARGSTSGRASCTSWPSATCPPPSGAHFCVEVDDLASVVTKLEAAGIEVSKGGGTPGAGGQAFCKDPAGNLIEFNQPDR